MMLAMAVRIGTHVSSAGGVDQAAERAHQLGCQAFQVFTASPRQWRARAIKAEAAERLAQLRRKYKLAPLVVHANYLINLAGAQTEFHARSLVAFRGELERAAAVGADYLVLHPGSGDLSRCAESLRQAADGFKWGRLELLIENTAGGGGHLGGDFGAVAALLERLRGLPVGACIDTCHAWAAGYDWVRPGGCADTLRALDDEVDLQRVPVFHANDAKSERGSHLDRHAHIGAGKMGQGVFRNLLRDPRVRGKAFIVETPPAGQPRDLARLRRFAAPPGRRPNQGTPKSRHNS